MNEWINEWAIEWMNEWMSDWTNAHISSSTWVEIDDHYHWFTYLDGIDDKRRDKAREGCSKTKLNDSRRHVNITTSAVWRRQFQYFSQCPRVRCKRRSLDKDLSEHDRENARIEALDTFAGVHYFEHVHHPRGLLTSLCSWCVRLSFRLYIMLHRWMNEWMAFKLQWLGLY